MSNDPAQDAGIVMRIHKARKSAMIHFRAPLRESSAGVAPGGRRALDRGEEHSDLSDGLVDDDVEGLGLAEAGGLARACVGVFASPPVA